MPLFRWFTVAAGCAIAAPAQQAVPRIGYVYPAGGQQGTTFQVKVGGQFLDGVKAAYVTGGGIQAKVREHDKPLTAAQANRLRDELKELVEKKGDPARIAEIRAKLVRFVRRPPNPAIAETVSLELSIAANAAPGTRELRLATPLGLTNPLIFRAGLLPEYTKPAATLLDDASTIPAAAARFRPPAPPPERSAPIEITLPATVNGQILPGKADRFRFRANKGQQVVAVAEARALIPYISDAVPGWFQAVLALYDAMGREAGYADDYRFHPDPVLCYRIPEDGEYTLEIKDAIYRGRQDFVYRIAVGELPYLTGIFPLGGRDGARTKVALTGWNLPQKEAAGVHPVTVRKGDLLSNEAPFALDTLPERTEQEPDNTARSAQRVKLPLIVNGRVARPGDVDAFRFDGATGQEVVIEVMARRLDSPLDSLLVLLDPEGRQLALNDDYEDKGMGWMTHHADSHIRVKLPRKGTYTVELSDAQRKGGADYSYRLRIGPPRPDFELRMAPASVTVRAGGTAPVTVYALRKDGFNGDIALKLVDPPEGVVMSGAWIPGGQEKVRLTLSVPPRGVESPFRLRLEGSATIAGKEVRRAGVPAEDMMQAFAYRHLVPAREWMVGVTGAARSRGRWQTTAVDRVRVPAGGSAPVKLNLPLGRMGDSVELALNEPPEGIRLERVSWSREGPSLLIAADAGKASPGAKGNLIVEAFFEREAPGDGKKKGGNRRQPLGVLPAIPYEVVRR